MAKLSNWSFWTSDKKFTGVNCTTRGYVQVSLARQHLSTVVETMVYHGAVSTSGGSRRQRPRGTGGQQQVHPHTPPSTPAGHQLPLRSLVPWRNSQTKYCAGDTFPLGGVPHYRRSQWPGSRPSPTTNRLHYFMYIKLTTMNNLLSNVTQSFFFFQTHTIYRHLYSLVGE